MYIAFIGQKGIPAHFGGIEYHVEEIAKRLVKLGHKIDVYVRDWYMKEKIKEYKGINLIYQPATGRKTTDTFIHSFFSTVSCMQRSYDIVHYHALGPAFFCWMPKLIGKKVSVTIHRLDWKSPKWKGIAKLFLRFCEYIAVCVSDSVIVVSRELKEYFENKYHRTVFYIPNGVDVPQDTCLVDIINEYNLYGKEYILWMGRIVPEKRVDWLINAFIRIKRNISNLRLKLVIAGGSSATDDYVNRIKKMAGGDKDIIFTGYVNGKEKNEILSNALVYVQPSCLEGLPIVVLEAMSYGVPCLVSDIEPHKELIEDGVNGFLFDSDDINDFVLKLQKVLSLPYEKLKEIGKKGKEKVKEEYNWDEIAKKTEKVYNEVLMSRI